VLSLKDEENVLPGVAKTRLVHAWGRFDERQNCKKHNLSYIILNVYVDVDIKDIKCAILHIVGCSFLKLFRNIYKSARH
jgi:hypothetical protein